MKKDPIVKAIQTATRFWREAKKPIMRTRLAGKATLLPCSDCPEAGQPKAIFRTTFDLSIAKLLLAFFVINAFMRLLKRIFW